jgi:signal transduction histidine kinase
MVRAEGRKAAAGGAALRYEEVEHDLKTPITSIRSLSEILRDFPDLAEEERRVFLERIVDENDRLAGAVERLLRQLASRCALS